MQKNYFPCPLLVSGDYEEIYRFALTFLLMAEISILRICAKSKFTRLSPCQLLVLTFDQISNKKFEIWCKIEFDANWISGPLPRLISLQSKASALHRSPRMKKSRENWRLLILGGGKESCVRKIAQIWVWQGVRLKESHNCKYVCVF